MKTDMESALTVEEIDAYEEAFGKGVYGDIVRPICAAARLWIDEQKMIADYEADTLRDEPIAEEP